MFQVHGRSRARSRRQALGALHRIAAVAAMLLLVAELGLLGVSSLRAGPARAAVAPAGQGFTVTPGDLRFILKQIKIAEHHSATLTPGQAVRDARRHRPGPDPRPPDRLRAAHGRRVLQQPLPRARDVRRRRPALPAAHGAHVQGRRELDLRPAARDVLQAEDGRRLRLAAARHQQPDRRPDVDEPVRGPGRGLPGAHAGQPGRRARARRTRTRSPTRPSPRPRPTACRRTRRSSSRT